MFENIFGDYIYLMYLWIAYLKEEITSVKYFGIINRKNQRTMKKLIYSLAAFMIGISMVNANQIASGTAQTVASNYYKQNAHKQVANATLAYTEKSATGDPIFYVFNMNNKEGFVIVSAEDAGRPIIGYSTEGNYIVPSATSNTEFNFWMEKRKSEIIAMRTQNVQATSEISSEWNNYASSKFSPPQTLSTAYGPLCLT